MNTLGDIQFVGLDEVQLGVDYFIYGQRDVFPVLMPEEKIRFLTLKRNRKGPVGKWVFYKENGLPYAVDPLIFGPLPITGTVRLVRDLMTAQRYRASLLTQKLEESIHGKPLERTATEAQMIADIWNKKLLAEFQKRVSFIGDKQQ